jgi:PAS domain S-box-containing protein
VQLSSDFGAPGEDRIDSSVPAVKYGLMQRMAALVEDSNDAIISVAGEATIASWNRAAEGIFGYTEQEMIGQPIFRLACVGEEGAMDAVLDQVRNGRRLDHYESRRRCKDGSEIPVSLTVLYGTLPGKSPESRRSREISLARSALKRLCELRRSWRL